MGNAPFIIKDFLQVILYSFCFTLVLLSLLSTIAKEKMKLPFYTFWNKYVVSMWVIALILLSVLRYYDLHKNKTIGLIQMVLSATAFFYAKGIFSSEITIPMMRIMLIVFLITIVL